MPPEDFAPESSRGAARLKLASIFRAAQIGSADLDARLLVCGACEIEHVALIGDPGAPLGSAAQTLSSYAVRRLAHEPVSRILGRREFWGKSFAISPSVLDPRPETEGLVGAVIDAIGGRSHQPLRILDLGTGSAAILCALLGDLPAASGIGVDRSLAACRVARGNITALGLAARASIICGSWADPIGGQFDVVISNPPYIRTDELSRLDPEVREFDPLEALDGGDDGLDPYRAIIPVLAQILTPDGVAAFECGTAQGHAVYALMSENGFRGVSVYKDLAGHDRVVLGARP